MSLLRFRHLHGDAVAAPVDAGKVKSSTNSSFKYSSINSYNLKEYNKKSISKNNHTSVPEAGSAVIGNGCMDKAEII